MDQNGQKYPYIKDEMDRHQRKNTKYLQTYKYSEINIQTLQWSVRSTYFQPVPRSLAVLKLIEIKGLGSLIFWKFQPLKNNVPYSVPYTTKKV